MTNVVRLELTGKRAEAWNRVFDTLTSVIERAIDQIAAGADEVKRENAHQLTRDIAEITKDFLKAKLERPALENELTIAEIALKFEELKLSKAKREQLEVETQIKAVSLESARLDLWERRLSVAVRWLCFLENHFVRSENGDVTLVLTNQDISSLLTDVRSIQQSAPAINQSGDMNES